jgi:uncharacterized protein involved in high-affinity Fe2+ transport
MRKSYLVFVAALMLLAASSAFAREHSIGKPVVTDGMILQPVYLQPVHMAPMLPGMKNGPYDVHLEIDIHADKNNPQGFPPSAWIPYLTVSYLIEKQDSDWSDFGTLMAMEADDGPHYGANLKLDGPGKYKIRFKIEPPPYNAFMRHTDKETGVSPWWKPFKQSWTFTYVGVGKKGGY